MNDEALKKYKEANKLFVECKAFFSDFDIYGWKNLAQSQEEREFFVTLNDLFLQQRQKELLQRMNVTVV